MIQLFSHILEFRIGDMQKKKLIFIRVREKFYIQTPEYRIVKLLFQEPTTKISDPNSKYYGSIDQNGEISFHRFIWEIKKLLIFFNSKGMFDQITLKCRHFGPYKF
jgi:hypothetical protein